MGYMTEFEGHFEISPQLDPLHLEYLKALSCTRRMQRDPHMLEGLIQGRAELRYPHLEVGLPLGDQGEYFVGGIPEGTPPGKRGATALFCEEPNPEDPFGWYNMGQQATPDVVEYNLPPGGQPSLWCHWHPQLQGGLWVLTWDGGEKFYGYIEWLEWIITHLLKPWGYTLQGEVLWWGEARDDFGKIEVHQNRIEVKTGTITY